MIWPLGLEDLSMTHFLVEKYAMYYLSLLLHLHALRITQDLEPHQHSTHLVS